MPPYTFYVGNFVHSKCLEKLDIFKGCVRVNHIGIIDCFAPRYKVEPSKIGPHGKLDQKAVDSELQYIPKEVLEALEKLDLEEKDAEKQVLKVLGREAKDTTIHIAREWQFFHPGLIGMFIVLLTLSRLFRIQLIIDELPAYFRLLQIHISMPVNTQTAGYSEPAHCSNG